MKKIAFSIVSVLAMIMICACGNTKVASKVAENTNKTAEIKKIKIVTTIYPIYDWVNNIIKGNEDKFDVSILMTSGVDLHNFQPSAKDIMDVVNSDLFIYVGGESDEWVDGAIKQAGNKGVNQINLMEVLKGRVKVEEEIEGMQEEEEHEEGEEHGEEYDEHVWLSLNNAINICKEIDKEIESLDSENANVYKNNTLTYTDELKKLDSEYRDIVSKANRKLLLFGDRFPFRYMVDDYGIKYYAAFKGCSAETEASFETIKFLADKLSEEQLPYVIKIERSNEKIAKAIIDNSSKKDAEIETMYSIQAVSTDDINNGATYISYMRKNLEVLKKVLN